MKSRDRKLDYMILCFIYRSNKLPIIKSWIISTQFTYLLQLNIFRKASCRALWKDCNHVSVFNKVMWYFKGKRNKSSRLIFMDKHASIVSLTIHLTLQKTIPQILIQKHSSEMEDELTLIWSKLKDIGEPQSIEFHGRFTHDCNFDLLLWWNKKL